jgi:hypothetical protein
MDGNDFFSFLLTDVRWNFLLETNLQRKAGRNGKKRFYSSFVTQQFSNGITTLSKWYRNGPLAMKRFRNGPLAWNDSLQRIETGCETFQEKRFENYVATISSVRNYIFLSGKYWGEMLMKNWKTDSILPRNDNHFHPFAMIMQRFNLEKLPLGKWKF